MAKDMDTMSDEEKYFLIKVSYLNFTNETNKPGKILENILAECARDTALDQLNRRSVISLSQELKNYPELGDLRLINYKNNNAFDPNATTDDWFKTGFAGYVLQDEVGNRVLLFRGSDPDVGVKFAQDMLDNSLSFALGSHFKFLKLRSFLISIKLGTKRIYC